MADLVASNTISSSAANELIEILFNEGGEPKVIIEERGMVQVNDDSALEAWADEAIAKNEKAVTAYKGGNATRRSTL